MTANLHYHAFLVEDQKKESLVKQFAGAVQRYLALWQRTPTAVHVRQDTPVPQEPGMEVVRDDRIPPAHWYFHVEKEVMQSRQS